MAQFTATSALPRYLTPPPQEKRLLPCAKRYAWLAQQAPKSHKYGFFIEPELKNFNCSHQEFLESLNFPKLLDGVEYWHAATFTFHVNGLQHCYVFSPTYAEREVDIQLPLTLTAAEVTHNLTF